MSIHFMLAKSMRLGVPRERVYNTIVLGPYRFTHPNLWLGSAEVSSPRGAIISRYTATLEIRD
ncbi:hypothetical protein BD413DRAFT_137943 [Trametes elegans]|nr:hypothetical protein BD413DRAFT_137943 [Trametes elegans]